MKRIFTFMLAILLTASVFAQSPEKMSYQAVIRDANDVLITNTQIGMQISILQGSTSGTPVYVETQTPTTNANGLVSIEIGTGTVVGGDFTTIDWANGPYFIKTETDPAGGASYSITGTSQLLSVPYALHAKTAESVTGTITETDPTFTSSQAANIDATDITNLGNLSGVNTGDQDLSTLATKTALDDSTAQVRSEIPDVSGFLTSETDPTFTSSEAANITAIDITNLGNLSGVNTGNQTLSLDNDSLFLSDDTAKIDLSELTIDKEWIFLTFPGATINSTTTVSIVNSSGNLPILNNTITLHADVCYDLDAKLVFNSTASISYQWYDVTNNLYLGSTGLYVGSTSQYGNSGTHFIIKPITDIEVELHIRSVSVSSTVQSSYSYGIIKEL